MNPLADKKTCTKCLTDRPFTDYYVSRRDPDGSPRAYRPHCKACTKAQTRDWKARNPDKAREHQKRHRENNPELRNAQLKRYRERYPEREAERKREWWQANPDLMASANHRRRARRASVPHQPYDRAELFARWNHECCYCSAPATDVEHILPISKGGADALHNLTIACQPCNSSKGAKTLAEWATSF